MAFNVKYATKMEIVNNVNNTKLKTVDYWKCKKAEKPKLILVKKCFTIVTHPCAYI